MKVDTNKNNNTMDYQRIKKNNTMDYQRIKKIIQWIINE